MRTQRRVTNGIALSVLLACVAVSTPAMAAPVTSYDYFFGTGVLSRTDHADTNILVVGAVAITTEATAGFLNLGFEYTYYDQDKNLLGSQQPGGYLSVETGYTDSTNYFQSRGSTNHRDWAFTETIRRIGDGGSLGFHSDELSFLDSPVLLTTDLSASLTYSRTPISIEDFPIQIPEAGSKLFLLAVGLVSLLVCRQRL